MTSYANSPVYQCPACAGYLLRARMRSFNDYGARYWSDGYGTFSTLPAMSPLIRCPTCPAMFWQMDVQPIGEIPERPMGEPRTGWRRWFFGRWPYDDFNTPESLRDWDAAPPEWKDAQYDGSPTYADLLRALGDVTGVDEAREIYVRRRIWWKANDRYRFGEDGAPLRGAPDVSRTEIRENMCRLVELHSAATDEISERAELLRQLGRFDEATQLLATATPDLRTTRLALDINRWATAKDSGLKLLEQGKDNW